MHTFTKGMRWLVLAVFMLGIAGTAHAQRTVTLRLNTASIPDTLSTDDFIEVRGAADPAGGTAYQGPYTYTNGGATIDWSDASTIEPSNIGGDFWEVVFQVDNEANTQFKFYSQQAQDGLGEGWESDPNPTIPPGTDDVVLPVHWFEAQRPYREFTDNDKGEYDWRPYENKDGMIAVWFRVYANTFHAVDQGYNRSDTDEVIIAGDGGTGAVGPDGTGMDWNGNSGVKLQRESSDRNTTGYDLFSGVAYYPESSAGMTQNFKFFVQPSGWEDTRGDRSFTIPSADSSLHWVYFGDDAPAGTAEPVTQVVIFSVDMDPLTKVGRDDGAGNLNALFDKARGDTLQVRGSFNGWDCDNPDDCLLVNFPGTNIYEAAVPMTSFPLTEQAYKFFVDFNNTRFETAFGEVPPSGWEEPISTTGADRKMIFQGDPNTEDFLGDVGFNDVVDEMVIPLGNSVDVTFTVDMSDAVNMPEPFDPAVHDVMIDFTGDWAWAFTQAMPRDGEGFILHDGFILDRVGTTMEYSGTLTVSGPTYNGIQYKFGYTALGSGSYIVEPGGTTAGLGRRRTRFVRANADGSWPAQFSFAAETFQSEGNLPFETLAGGVAVEEVEGELPTKVHLDQNYPNPFNPVTSIEYAIDAASDVRLDVYDLLGRKVATLVDARQPAANYRVSFDATDLSSGTYLYRLSAGNQIVTRTMVLLK